MSDNSPENFSLKQRAFLVAPAGFGKTEHLAKAVACQNTGRQLILTHTHAGVKSLHDRLRKHRVSSRLYGLDTIAGFSLKYVASFPKSSGLDVSTPVPQDWNKVYEAAAKILSSSVGKHIIRSSYTGLYVDEYQDCTLIQHKLIMSLAELLPCRIVGDPLQGIFDFEDSPLVDWPEHILPHFERLPDLDIPWRWENGNKTLGNWLLTVRNCLLCGKPINLHDAPHCVKRLELNVQNQIATCFASITKQGSIVAIHRMPQEAHSIAQNLKGAFTSMEEIECKDLLKWSAKLEQCTSTERAIAVIDFSSLCMTKVSTELKAIKSKLGSGDRNIVNSKLKHKEIALALSKVANSDDLKLVIDAFYLIENIQGRVLYRRELWHEMKKAIKERLTEKYTTLHEAAWSVRDKGRIWGRRVEHRTVSRTLLIKGLEFDHAIVLNADKLGAKELYVAMTRGSQSLTILSSTPILQKEAPAKCSF